MTDIDDFGWPIGYDADPEPVDWYEAQEPLDLDAIDEACCIYANSDDDKAKQKALSYVMSVAQALVAEARAGRERIAEWEALPTREERAVTPGRDSVPGDGVTISCDVQADHAKWLARSKDAQMWRRMLSVRSWEPIELDAPF